MKTLCTWRGLLQMKRFLIIAILLIAVPCWGATYNYYFAASGSGGSDGNNCLTTGTACETISKVNSMIGALSSGDIVNIYFNRGDTWSTGTDTRTLAQSAAVIYVGSSDPEVHFNAYGSGDKPVLNGLEDFTSPDSDNCSTAPNYPCRYSIFFHIYQKDDCSIQNLEIKNVYGHAIKFEESDGAIVKYNEIYNIGNNSVQLYGGSDNGVIEYNKIYLGQRLYQTGAYGSWGNAISTIGAGASNLNPTIRYNLVYDIYGECIYAHGDISYNVIGDCGSLAIDTSPANNDALDTTVAYNFIVFSSWATSVYDNHSGGDRSGIRIFDEYSGGDNSNADYDIYGNIIINRANGIKMLCDEDNDTGEMNECNTFGDGTGHIYIYNNTFINSHSYNILFQDPTFYENVKFYNNHSLMIDGSGSDPGGAHTNTITTGTNWDIDSNAFWTDGGSPSYDSDFSSNVVVTDPLLAGQSSVNWSGQTGAAYFFGISFSDLLPGDLSQLIGNGKTLGAGYDATILTTGTDFSDLPDTATFSTLEQSSWVIGAYGYDGVPTPPWSGVSCQGCGPN